MRQWIYENDSWEKINKFKKKKTLHKANVILISSTKRRGTEASSGTVSLQEQRRIGFALSAFVVHVCELWLKKEDSLSTLGPFCPIVSRPLPYPPAQKIQTAAQSNAHPLCAALSHWAGPAQTQTDKDQRNYAPALTAAEGEEVSVISHKGRWNINTKGEGCYNMSSIPFHPLPQWLSPTPLF